MEILLLLIPLSALVVVGAGVMFFRAVDSGQFEDLDRQGRTTRQRVCSVIRVTRYDRYGIDVVTGA